MALADVFISYKHKQREQAGRVAELLRASAYDLWWDRKLRSGDDFQLTISKELEAAGCGESFEMGHGVFKRSGEIMTKPFSWASQGAEVPHEGSPSPARLKAISYRFASWSTQSQLEVS